MRMTFDGTVARLHMQSVHSEMSGTYKCLIVNEFGKEESIAQLTVIGKQLSSIDLMLRVLIVSSFCRQKEEGEGKRKLVSTFVSNV